MKKLSLISAEFATSRFPFGLELGQGGDSGVPLLVSAPDSENGWIFQQVARELSEKSKSRNRLQDKGWLILGCPYPCDCI